MSTGKQPAPSIPGSVNRLVTYVHVADVEASLAFYALLGFVPQNVMKDVRGRAFWALAQSDRAEIMFARADGPVDSDQQAVLFYMYSTDVAALRRHLLESGLHDGGNFHGKKGSEDGKRVVFEVTRRDYMPAGEMRVHDPDAYCILIGQLG